MKIFSANLESLGELYNNHLEKALDMEQQITKALPMMMDKATDMQVKQALQSHLQETETHVEKLKQLLGNDETSTCKAMSGLLTEGSDAMKDVKDTDLRDVVIISGCQEVEHHEIAVYGTLKNWARLLGLQQDVAILESIERDEVHADKLLTEISSRVNSEASMQRAAA